MYRRAVFAFFCAGAVTFLCAQPPPALPADVLHRFQSAVKQTLDRLPDYTCMQTITRSRRDPNESLYHSLDTIRLQVGLIGGHERYAWPGAARFDDRELRDLVNRGIIGTGDFAGHVRHVFLSPGTRFTPRGTVTLGDRTAARFDYEVPVEYSQYRLRVPPEEAIVGVRGSFWFDLDTLDLLRLEVYADEIPPELGMLRIRETIDYARIPIGDSDFLLAASSELIMVAAGGEEYRNQIKFAECLHFRADSSIRFGGEDITSPQAASSRPAVRAVLPASLLVELELDSEIDPETAALGDSIRAIVTSPIRDGKQVIAPEGSIVHGRLVRLERSTLPVEHYVIGLEFHSLESGDTRFALSATMQDAGPARGLLRQTRRLAPIFTRKRTTRLDILVREKPRGEGVLYWDAKHRKVGRGLKMRWLTIDDEPGSRALSIE